MRDTSWMTSFQSRVYYAAPFVGHVVLTRPGDSFACWEWNAGRNAEGYGRVRYSGKSWYAHRLSRHLAFGDLPEAVCHHCDNPPCVNPEHLRSGTLADNQRESWAKGRHSVLTTVRVDPTHLRVFADAVRGPRLGRRRRLEVAAHACGVSLRTAYRTLSEDRPSYRILRESAHQQERVAA